MRRMKSHNTRVWWRWTWWRSMLGTDAVPWLARNPPTHFQILVSGREAEMLCGLTCVRHVNLDWQASWALPQCTGFWGGVFKQGVHRNSLSYCPLASLVGDQGLSVPGTAGPGGHVARPQAPRSVPREKWWQPWWPELCCMILPSQVHTDSRDRCLKADCGQELAKPLGWLCCSHLHIPKDGIF